MLRVKLGVELRAASGLGSGLFLGVTCGVVSKKRANWQPPVGARRAAEAAGRERGGLEGAWAARYLLLAAGSRVVARLGGRTHPA